jgi:hypothetical protein
MPLGPYSTWGDCHRAQMMKGHSAEEADRICGSLEASALSSQHSSSKEKGIMSSEIAAFPPKDGEEKKEEPKAEVSFNETELGVVTQFLTDAQDYLTADANAPAELKEEAGKAFEVVYSKVNVSADEEQKPPQ